MPKLEIQNLKLGNASTSLCFSQFQVSNFKFHCQNIGWTKCKLLLACHEGCRHNVPQILDRWL